MDMDPFQHLQNQKLGQLADLLGEIRDSWMLISLELKDWMADAPSPARDDVQTEVERYLCRLREADRRDFD